MTYRCIYCLKEKSDNFFKKTEHIIPQSFGKFQNNLTLHKFVCDECNQYFGDDIELVLGRDSLEGIARYNYGIFSRKEPLYNRISMKLESAGDDSGSNVKFTNTEKDKEAKVELISQVGFFNSKTKSYDYFNEKEIPSMDELVRKGYDLKRFIRTRGDVDYFVDVLKKRGMEVKVANVEDKSKNINKEKTPVRVEARIDRKVSRGISKILFNYLAFIMDREFVLKKEFNGIRKFIRYNQGQRKNYYDLTTESILYHEKKFKRRILQGHIITLKWENNKNDLVGLASLFNAQVGLTHKVIFCRNYKGIWIPVTKGHYFDVQTKQIRTLIHTNLTLP